MRQPVKRKSAAHRMRGSIAITAALWLMVIVTALCAVDVGHVWWQRRHLQGVADMLALAGAQRLDITCTGDMSALTPIATSNGYSGSFTASCGRFDTSSNVFTVAASSDDPTINAVNVEINSNINYWFMPMIGKTGQGIDVASMSRVVNIGAYTLGTTLLTLQSGNSAVLNALLGGLLGSTVNLDVASYTALANAQVKLGDLAAQINSNGANDIVQMLAASPTLQSLISAIDNTLSPTDPARAALSSLAGSANTAQGGHTAPMNGANGQVGVLDVGLENTNAATNATVDALDLITVAAMVANTKGSTVAPITVSASLMPNLPLGLSATNISLSLGQPPVLAVGEAGTLAATARSQQVQLLLTLGISVDGLVTVNLPVYISVAPATASLTQTQCGAGTTDSKSTISVLPGIASVCVADNASKLFNGTASSCGSQTTLVNVVNLITVISPGISVPLNPGTPQSLEFTGVGTQLTPKVQSVNSNALGSDLTTALTSGNNSVLANLAGNLKVTVGPLSNLLGLLGLNTLVADIVGSVVSLLGPTLNLLVPPLLNIAGVQVGQATVTGVSLTCGNVQLVQ